VKDQVCCRDLRGHTGPGGILTRSHTAGELNGRPEKCALLYRQAQEALAELWGRFKLSKWLSKHHANCYLIIVRGLGNTDYLLPPAGQDRCKADSHAF